MSEKISITRALVKKKNLSDRINRMMQNGALRPIVVLRGTQVPTGFSSIADYEASVRSDFQSLTDLIKERQKITESIILSNAKTSVKIGDEEITVAEAIERKNFYKGVKLPHINFLKQALSSATHEHERVQTDQQEKVEQALKSFVGRDKSGTSSELEPIRNSLEKQYSVTLIDPLKLAETIKKEEDLVVTFLTDVDIVLTESNSKTEIEI